MQGFNQFLLPIIMEFCFSHYCIFLYWADSGVTEKHYINVTFCRKCFFLLAELEDDILDKIL